MSTSCSRRNKTSTSSSHNIEKSVFASCVPSNCSSKNVIEKSPATPGPSTAILKYSNKRRMSRVSSSGWTKDEDNRLSKMVKKYNGRNWKVIASYFDNRRPEQCLHRWQKVLNPHLTKGLWDWDEDMKLISLVEKHKPKQWSFIASHISGRNGKQCRERWYNHLDPNINKTPFTPQEDKILISAQQRLGNKWSEIAALLHGRTSNAVKNRWHSSLKKSCVDSVKTSVSFGKTLGVRSRSARSCTKTKSPFPTRRSTTLRRASKRKCHFGTLAPFSPSKRHREVLQITRRTSKRLRSEAKEDTLTEKNVENVSTGKPIETQTRAVVDMPMTEDLTNVLRSCQYDREIKESPLFSSKKVDSQSPLSTQVQKMLRMAQQYLVTWKREETKFADSRC